MRKPRLAIASDEGETGDQPRASVHLHHHLHIHLGWVELQVVVQVDLLVIALRDGGLAATRIVSSSTLGAGA